MKSGPCIEGLAVWKAWKESEAPLRSDASLELHIWYEERREESRGAWIEHRRRCKSCSKLNSEHPLKENVLKSFIGHLVKHSSIRSMGTRL